MKWFCATILVLSLLSHHIYNAIVIGYFVANQSYIAKTLCINKSKPQLKCNGKCYLKKRLKQDHQEMPELASMKVEYAPQCIHEIALVHPIKPSRIYNTGSITSQYEHAFSFIPFQPPRV